MIQINILQVGRFWKSYSPLYESNSVYFQLIDALNVINDFIY